jgi:hypothetical protein
MFGWKLTSESPSKRLLGKERPAMSESNRSKPDSELPATDGEFTAADFEKMFADRKRQFGDRLKLLGVVRILRPPGATG